MDETNRPLYQTIFALSQAVEERDLYTSAHLSRVARLSRSIAQELGMDADQVNFVRVAATLHDCGKVAIPAEILTRPTRLTRPQFELVKTHSEIGYRILKGVDFPWPVAEVVLQHHERLDGTGYPRGLKGRAIMPEARIIAVADTMDALVSRRPYRAEKSPEDAIDVLREVTGRLFDRQVVKACETVVRSPGGPLDAQEAQSEGANVPVAV